MDLITVSLLQAALLQSTLLQAIAFGYDELSGPLAFTGRVAFIVIMFVIVAFSAYYTTKFIASSKRKIGNSNNMKVIEGIALSPHANIQLVSVAGQYFLIGVTKENITFLTEVSGENISISENLKAFMPFESYLNKVFNKNAENKVADHEDQGGEGDV